MNVRQAIPRVLFVFLVLGIGSRYVKQYLDSRYLPSLPQSPPFEHLSPLWSHGTNLSLHFYLSTSISAEFPRRNVPYEPGIKKIQDLEWPKTESAAAPTQSSTGHSKADGGDINSTNASRTTFDRKTIVNGFPDPITKAPVSALPSYAWHNIILGDVNDKREIQIDVDFPTSLQLNSPIWADIYLTINNSPPDPADPNYDESNVHHVRIPLTDYFPRIDIPWLEKTVQGITSENSKAKREITNILENAYNHSHWHPELTLMLVSNPLEAKNQKLLPLLHDYIHIEKDARNASVGHYFPIIYPQRLWQLRSEMIPVDHNVLRQIHLDLSLRPVKFDTIERYIYLGEIAESIAGLGPLASSLLIETKRMISQNPIWLLNAVTFFVFLRLLYTVATFESFELPRTSIFGTSLNAMMLDVASRFILIRYLFNHEEVNKLICLWETLQLIPTVIAVRRMLSSRKTAPISTDETQHGLKHDIQTLGEQLHIGRDIINLAVPSIAAYGVVSYLSGNLDPTSTALHVLVFPRLFIEIIRNISPFIMQDSESIPKSPVEEALVVALNALIYCLTAILFNTPVFYTLAKLSILFCVIKTVQSGNKNS